MTRMFHKNPNFSVTLVRIVPDRTAKAIIWTVMVVLCAAAHFEFMRLISPFASTIGF